MFNLTEKRQRTYNGKIYTTWHGAPFDRGSADSYYQRPRDPHWYPQGTYNGERVGADRMTQEEIEAYHAGYNENDELGGKKDWL